MIGRDAVGGAGHQGQGQERGPFEVAAKGHVPAPTQTLSSGVEEDGESVAVPVRVRDEAGRVLGQLLAQPGRGLLRFPPTSLGSGQGAS